MKKNFTLLAFAALGFAALTFTGCKPEPEPVKVTSVSLSETAKTLEIGQTLTLTATVLPETADNKSVTWSCEPATGVVTVVNGLVTAVAEGSVVVTATAADGSGKNDSCTITVSPEPVVAITSTHSLTDVNTINYSDAFDGEGNPIPVAVMVAASRNIGSLTLSLTTDNPFLNGVLTQMGVTEPFELGSLTPEQTAALTMIGIPSGDDVIGKDNVAIPFSGILAVIAGEPGIPGGIDQFDITIEAEGTDGQGSDNKTLKLKFVDDVPAVVSITGDEFDIDEVLTIKASQANSEDGFPVKVDIVASKGIAEMKVGIDSSSPTFLGNLAEMGMDEEFDLANPSSELAGLLNALQILPYGDAVKGKKSLPFDITTFIPLIFTVTAAEGTDLTAEFTLTVVDVMGNEDSKTLQLNLIREVQLPNGGFEDWSSTTNSMTGAVTTWFTYKDAASRFWDTANPGLNLAGNPEDRNPTLPSDDVRPGSTGSTSAYMNSRYVRVVIVNKFAAGNLFTGSFGKVEMMKGGASVNFGQPFTARPAALKGWFKANAGTITHAGEGSPKAIGQPDEYQIYIALTTWDKPHQVDTWDPTTFMDFTGDDTVAYGEISGTGAVEDWDEFEIPLVYKSEATPTHIVVVATSSKYGDYFTGSTDSWLMVDDFELVY